MYDIVHFWLQPAPLFSLLSLAFVIAINGEYVGLNEIHLIVSSFPCHHE